MRILFIGAHFPRPNNPTIGIWALAQIEALQAAGHEIKVISPVPAIPTIISRLFKRGSSAECPARHFWGTIEAEYVRWPLYPVGPFAKMLRKRPDIWVRLAWIFSARKFLKAARQFVPSVILAHHGALSGLIAAEVSRQIHVPFLVTEHAFGDIESCEFNPKRKQHYLNIISDVSRWIAVSNRMRDTMLKVFPNAPSLTVHNGGDRVPPSVSNIPRPDDLADCIIVLCICFFYKRKNVPLLIRSFDAIAARHPKARLIIVGSGDDHAAIDAAIGQAANPQQILLKGHLSHADALKYTVWSDIVANIAVDEPFSTVFSDALTAGKPIIFSTDCGITDIARSEVHGLSVIPGDQASASAALDTLLSDSGRRSTMGNAAAMLARTQLSWEENAKRMIEQFDIAIAEQAGDFTQAERQ